jgi:L-amino acid N-acyltransferase YncA
LYDSATTPGLGNILLHKIIEEAARRGLKFISSYISTNNLPVVKVHISEGFTITNISYVYVKHGES